MTRPRPGEIAVSTSQLRPGVHVRIPLPWMAHHFLLSSFVIENDDQVRQLAALGLPDLLCDVTRCRVPPLPRAQSPVAPPSDAELRASRP
ncbi:MAG: DUF3391 domain-containing protein [Burkholderiales bacterium]